MKKDSVEAVCQVGDLVKVTTKGTIFNDIHIGIALGVQDDRFSIAPNAFWRLHIMVYADDARPPEHKFCAVEFIEKIEVLSSTEECEDEVEVPNEV